MLNEKNHAYIPNELLRGALDSDLLIDSNNLSEICPAYTSLTQVSQEPYRDRKLIGKGALKEVYKCYDEKSKRYVAVASLRTDLPVDYYDQLIHEAWLTSSLNHPNIIKIYETAISAEGAPYFVMDLKGNTTLQDYTQCQPREELIAAYLKICDAIAYAHSMGIIHLDLKPANIQCDHYGEVLVCDWGLAKVSQDREKSYPELGHLLQAQHLTLFGQIKGSIGFMAPEQAESNGSKDQRTDIFALGCILYYIVTGKRPFQQIEDMEISKHGGGNYKFEELRTIPKSLAAIIVKATKYKPENRYQSVESLQKDLLLYTAGHATKAERANVIRKSKLFIIRHSKFITVSALSFSLVCALSIVAFKRQQLIKESETQVDILHEDIENMNYQNRLFEDFALDSEILYSKLDVLLDEFIRSSGELEEPIRAHSELDILVEKTLQIDPHNLKARQSQFRSNLGKMNFAAVLKEKPIPRIRKEFYDYASLCPNYAFSRDNRPTIQEMVNFVQAAETIPNINTRLMSQIIQYDVATRQDMSQYGNVVIAVLKLLNMSTQDFSAQMDTKYETMLIKSSKHIRLELIHKLRSPMKYLPLRNLVISGSGSIFLNDLDSLEISTLDLREIDRVIISKQIEIKGLERIIIHRDSHLKAKLKKFITSPLDYRIIETE